MPIGLEFSTRSREFLCSNPEINFLRINIDNAHRKFGEARRLISSSIVLNRLSSEISDNWANNAWYLRSGGPKPFEMVQDKKKVTIIR